MPQPHKHAAVIKAWADGIEIQFRSHGDIWYDYPKVGGPSFHEDWEYRVKPKVKRYRVGKTRNGGLFAIQFESSAACREIGGNFSHWITDWLEYEDVSATS